MINTQNAILFKKPPLNFYNTLLSCYFHKKFALELEYKKCYKILGVSEDSDQEQIRKAYLQLVKKYHPDSGSSEADPEKFQQIDEAFKKLINKLSKERWNVEEAEAKVEEQDIKHTAPQHRQYLTYGGYGHGNPFQREKQYTKIRAMHAAENVYQHRVAKVTADDKALLTKVPLKHNIKTKYGFERLVEDLIQESMSKGEFSNLSGCGKPLKSHENRNPYVDFVTHKLNEILIDNGFTPEWITLQKEIRQEAKQLRKMLLKERQRFGPFPLSVEDNIEWSERVFLYQNIVDSINKKILKFNLVVPILDKQMLQICLEKEAQNAIITGDCYEDVRGQNNNDQKQLDNTDNTPNFFVSLFQLFKK